MSAHTQDRIHFASAGAIRSNARTNGDVEEAVRTQKLRTKRPVVSVVRNAFATLLSELAENPPEPVMGDMDAYDLNERAEHMQAVLSVVEKYAEAVLADAKYRTSGLDFDVNVTGRLSDMQGDLVGAFRNAADAMRAARS